MIDENIKLDYLFSEIQKFKMSKKRRDMLVAERYYKGNHDILKRKRTVIGADGEQVEVDNLVNNKIVDNQYRKIIEQKNNYLLGNPITLQSDNDAYNNNVKLIMNRRCHRTFKNMGVDALNYGISWLYVYYRNSMLDFKKLKSYEMIPFFEDDDRTVLESAIRVYTTSEYINGQDIIIEKADYYTTEGIYYYNIENSKLIPVDPFFSSYIINNEGQSLYWGRVPLIPFKINSGEIPLVNNIKCLQDGLNLIESNFQNNMEEDTHNTILVLENYDGENLAEFRRNLSTYGAVKVRNSDGAGGGVSTLRIEVNADNYNSIISLFKKAVIENAMGYDAKDDRMGSNANQMNILSMYSDIDLDANNTETEFQASFVDLFYFIDLHLKSIGKGDFTDINMDIIFNRDILMNESEIIDNCVKSIGILSDETIVANHPWVVDTKTELDRIQAQKEKEDYSSAFNQVNEDII